MPVPTKAQLNALKKRQAAKRKKKFGVKAPLYKKSAKVMSPSKKKKKKVVKKAYKTSMKKVVAKKRITKKRRKIFASPGRGKRKYG